MKKVLNMFLSNIQYLLGRLLKSPGLLRASAHTDTQNFRAAKQLYQNKVSESEFETILFDGLVTLSRAKTSKSETGDFLAAAVANFPRSKAQLFQDIFALTQSGWKQNGYFVEVGVGDGEFLSNTYLLEKEFNWNGLLVEPDPRSHHLIEKNRTAQLDKRAAFSVSGQEVDFLCNDASGELSTIASFSDSDHHVRAGRSIKVKTITLNDLFAERRVPAKFDYLSVDTEGSEFDVLSSIDFSRFQPAAISVEHNYDQARLSKIEALLNKSGYRKVMPNLSQWDAWFVRA